MMKHGYSSKVSLYCMLIMHLRLFFILFFLLLSLLRVDAQNDVKNEKEIQSTEYEVIQLLVIIEGYGNFYLDVIFDENNLVYINIGDMFKTLKINCIKGQRVDSLSGFIENEKNTYAIDFKTKEITVGNKSNSTPKGMLSDMGSIYLESSLVEEFFGIKLSYNPRALTIVLKSSFELPIVKQSRIEKVRGNLSYLTNNKEVNSDIIISRKYHLLKLGVLDWSIASSQALNRKSNNALRLGLGTEFIYGETDITINFYNQQKFDKSHLQYIWRWIDNNKSLIKQAQVGKISNQSIALLNAPVVGAVIRNTPTTVRKATGFYTIDEYTEPNWTVELYINNVMIDYTKADASGLYSFKVPIVYGFTTLKLMFYGPMGEERTEERIFNMPYTVMPTNEFEYGLSYGILQDSSNNRFGRCDFNYGVNRLLTFGGGLEYLSSIPNQAYIPFANFTLQPISKLTINGEYAIGVRSRVLLNYYFNKNVLIEIDYLKNAEGQKVTSSNSLEERKTKISIPFKIKKLNVFSKFEFNQFVYKTFNYNKANIILSTYYKKININSNSQINWISDISTYIFSDLAISYRIRNGYTLRTSTQYNANEGKIGQFKITVEKIIPKGFLSISYERNLLYKENLVNLNFKYDLSFARTNITANYSKGEFSLSENAQGSIAIGSGNNYVYSSMNSSISKGGISIYPFFDLNDNGIFDKNEHLIKLNFVKVMGGKPIYRDKDSIIRIPDLNAFTNYFVELNDNDLDNISWRFKYKKYQVLIDPNQFKRIDIPISSVGEVNGMVYMNSDNVLKGIGRILVKIYNQSTDKVIAETLTESDGYFSYLGLEKGKYIARFDTVQLNNLNFSILPAEIEFTINAVEDGDIVGGIDFVLNERKNEVITIQDTSILLVDIYLDNDSLKRIDQKINLTSRFSVDLKIDSIFVNKVTDKPFIENDNILIWGEMCSQTGYYYVQCGAFKVKDNSLRLAKYLKMNTGFMVGVILNGGFYKVQVGCYPDKIEADRIKEILFNKIDCNDMFMKDR